MHVCILELLLELGNLPLLLGHYDHFRVNIFSGDVRDL